MLPLVFEANQGQTSGEVKFLSRGNGYTLFLTSQEAVLSLIKGPGDGTVVRTKLLGSHPSPRVTGLEELSGKVNYLIGNDPRQWRTNLPTYAKVKYESVYPGVDLLYYGSQRTLEYDFIVAPGADPKAITLSFEGPEALEVDAQGDVVLKAAGGEVRLRKPLVYQEADGQRTPIAGQYALKGKNQIGFQVAAYDVKKPLVIDPVLAYSTYLGGSGVDQAFGIAVDASGNAYVTGATQSANFPTTLKTFDSKIGGNTDAFVTKLDGNGKLVYSTYLGGGSPDSGAAIAVDGSGNAYITGQTQSANFPITAGAFEGVNGGSTDAFVTVLNAGGSILLYSSFLGGNNLDAGLGIAVAPASVPTCSISSSLAATNIYVTGFTTSSNFPTTNGAFDRTIGGGKDAFVAMVHPCGAGLSDFVYSTLLGGTGDDVGSGIAVASGFIYVTGSSASADFPITQGALDTTWNGGTDAFVSKLNPAGTGAADLAYSTFLGGSGNDSASAIALDGSGNVYVTGSTTSADFPATVGAFQITSGGLQDAFVTKLNPNVAGSAGLLYSTYLGGSGNDAGNGIAVSGGTIFVSGSTGSPNFPPGGLSFTGTNTTDAFVAAMNPAGNNLSDLIYSTILGGNGADTGHAIAVDGSGAVYVAGDTSSTNFPIVGTPAQTKSGGLTDAFVVKLAARGATTTLVSSSANPSSTGQPVTFTATISPSTATGTVQFTVDGTNLSTVTVANGTATSGTISTLAAGPHTVSAVYSGDANFLGSTGSLTQTVGQSVFTQTALTSSQNPSVFGQSVTFTATVTASSGTPTGTVTFNDGNNNIVGCVNLAVSSAQCSTSALAVGVHSITATYAPASGSNFSGSTSPAVSQVVNFSSTTTTVASSLNPSVFGQSVTFTATVAASGSGSGTPTGTVTFNDGGATISGCVSISLVSSQAQCTPSSLSAGPHSITAVYSGDSSFSGSTSGTLSQTVSQATTSTALASSPNPSSFGQPVTFTATVSVVSPGAGTPTGTVTFNDGSNNILGCVNVVMSSGQAQCTTSSLLAGSHSIAAAYGGDSNFSGSTSPSLAQTVSAPFDTIPDLTIVEPEPLLITGVSPGVNLTVSSSDQTLVNNLYISPVGSTRLFTYQRPVATQPNSGAVTITVTANNSFTQTFTITLKPDNCPGVPNPNQSDVDNDGIGDACDDNPNGFDATVTASIVKVSPPPLDSGYAPGDALTATVAVTFNPSAAGPYFALLPSPYNIILKVLDSQGQIVLANHILEGPPVRIALAPTGDLAQIGQTAQTFTIDVVITDWHVLQPGSYTIHADYVSEGVKDPEFDKGVCAPGADCFAPVWQGTAPAFLTIGFGDQCLGDNIPFGQGPGGTGCPFADKATVIHKNTAGWAALAGTAYPGVQVRIYDRNDPAFQAAYGKNPGQSQFPTIFEAEPNIGRAGQCVTGADGVAFCGENNKGSDLIIIKALGSGGNIFYDGKPTNPIDFDANGIAAKSFAVP